MMLKGRGFGPGETTFSIIDGGAIQGPRISFPYLPHRINSADVGADGKTLSNKRPVADVATGFLDRMCLDETGQVRKHSQVDVSSLEGIHGLDPKDPLIGKMPMAKQAANLSFSDVNNDILFTGSRDSLLAVKLNIRGLLPVRNTPDGGGSPAGRKQRCSKTI